MKYHIVAKNGVGNNYYMLVSNEPLVEICWVINKTIATEFEQYHAERLINVLEYVADVKGLTIESAVEAWVLAEYNFGNSKPGFYFAGADDTEGITWSDKQDTAYPLDSEEEAKKYSQALKTLFDINTTPKKVS